MTYFVINFLCVKIHVHASWPWSRAPRHTLVSALLHFQPCPPPTYHTSSHAPVTLLPPTSYSHFIVHVLFLTGTAPNICAFGFSSNSLGALNLSGIKGLPILSLSCIVNQTLKTTCMWCQKSVSLITYTNVCRVKGQISTQFLRLTGAHGFKHSTKSSPKHKWPRKCRKDNELAKYSR